MYGSMPAANESKVKQCMHVCKTCHRTRSSFAHARAHHRGAHGNMPAARRGPSRTDDPAPCTAQHLSNFEGESSDRSTAPACPSVLFLSPFCRFLLLPPPHRCRIVGMVAGNTATVWAVVRLHPFRIQASCTARSRSALAPLPGNTHLR